MNLTVILKSTIEFSKWLFNGGNRGIYTLPSEHSAEDDMFKKRVLKNVHGDVWISKGNIFTSEQHEEYVENAFRN